VIERDGLVDRDFVAQHTSGWDECLAVARLLPACDGDSVHLFVGDLPERLPQVAELGLEGPVWTICASGHRSAMAASLLAGAGIPVRAVARGGVEDWLASCSSPSG